ncbi:MAG: ATP-dependent Clp protease proteolytic subunit [Candidatus Ornithospirochaeta sp.]
MRSMPIITTKVGGSDVQCDIFSLLLKDRVIFLNGPIDDTISDLIIAELLYLNSQDNTKDISLYINSPGGSVSAGLAIYDTIRYIKAPVHTIAMGLAASMASVILSSGDKRSLLPHTKVMIHQPLIPEGIGGKETDIAILAKDLTSTRRTISEILSRHTGKTVKQIERDIENDRYMTAEEAISYGLADRIIKEEA